jgi:hypothetical protein
MSQPSSSLTYDHDESLSVDGSQPEPHPSAPTYSQPHGWRFLLMAELSETAVARPWGPAVMALGWVHLAFFAVCQALFTRGVRTEWVFAVLWGSELGAVLLALRLVAGRGWYKASPAVGLIVRVWVTFLILSFNVASLNSLTGWTLDWFKPVWCTLASFGFATMAWLFGLRFLVPAFQMYFTGLMMVKYPDWNYVIHSASWWLATQYLGMDLVRLRSRIRTVRRQKASLSSATAA